jgi:hypothetical protein
VAGFTTTNTTTSNNSMSGNWSFVGKAKGVYKNKERIVLNATTVTSSDQTTSVTTDNNGVLPAQTTVGDTDTYTNNYSNGQAESTWDIDQLKGKEMIVKQSYSNNGTWSNTTSAGVTTSGNNSVYTASSSTTLSAVK